MERLDGKHILLGVCGSIAAYKAPLLVRLLRQAGADVRVAMTPTARHFVSPLVLGNLAGESVATDMFDERIQQGGSWHIHWAHWADVMLIAPCSAQTLASLACGGCDTVVACLALALPRPTPLLVAPAMDTTMWEHPATVRNAEQLRRDGAIIIEPEEGELASGLWGTGRMPEPESLFRQLVQVLSSHSRELRTPHLGAIASTPLQTAIEHDRLTAEIELAQLKAGDVTRLDGKTVLITAGPTREALDSVRYISNRSSGKMGYALAEAARDRGAHVVLISGPVALPQPDGVDIVRIESARQMFDAVLRYEGKWDIAIAAAAVADYMPADVYSGKLKRNVLGDRIAVELIRTPDILGELGRAKMARSVLVGFALESSDQLDGGIEKLHARGCDIAVLNAFDVPDSGFEGDLNTITIVTFSNGQIHRKQYSPVPKRVCAEYVLDDAVALLRRKQDPEAGSG